MHKHVEESKVPIFYAAEPPLDYSNKRVTWTTFLELIKPKDKQRTFWDFSDSLKTIRQKFNDIIM